MKRVLPEGWERKGCYPVGQGFSCLAKKPCQDSIPIELNGAKPTTHRAIYGYTFLGRWLCAQLPGWLSVQKMHCRCDYAAYSLGESCVNTESFGL